MKFDPLSFTLGFASASGVSLLAWRSRRQLAGLRDNAQTQFENTRQFIGQTADSRYKRDLLRSLQRRHTAGNLFDLTSVLLEPRLIAPPGAMPPPGMEDIETRDIFDVVPMHHDFPQCYAPFNIETMSLDDLGAGDRHVAILGISGLGKSTTLASLALMAMGKVRFETLEDMTERAIEEEEAGLSNEERKQRAEQREEIQARAMEKLHTAQEKQKQELGIAIEEEHLPLINIGSLLPVLVHLNDIELDENLYGVKKGAPPPKPEPAVARKSRPAAVPTTKRVPVDPAEPLVRAAQRWVTSVTSQVVGSVIYPALEKGTALVLIDGYDELSPAVRETYFYWLKQFVEVYGQNMIVIAGPATGFEPLLSLGFTPSFLRAWTEEDYERLAGMWSKAWAAKYKTAPLDEPTMRRLTVDNQGRTALEVTLKLWTALADDARETGRAGWYDALINRQFSVSEARDLLPVLAAELLEAGQPLNRASVQQVLAQAIAARDEIPKAIKPETMLDALVKNGLMTVYAADRFSFVHPQVVSYLAGEVLAGQPEQAVELALDPAWQDAIGLAGGRIDLLPLIVRKLSSPPDLLYTDLFELVRWLPDAPSDAPWRGDLFKRLAAAMMAQEQYPSVRERALVALIASRDKNVIHVLRKGLLSADADIRRLACVGLGALGNAEAVDDLTAMLTDKDQNVKLAAALSLGALGTAKSIEIMVQRLFSEGAEIQRAIAEALAALPGEGHELLRDAANAQEIEIRRASIYGLSRVRASWALAELYRAMLQDQDWRVRSAADEAFQAAQSPDKDGPRKHPEADILVWLIKWAGERGEGVPTGPNSRQVLIRVLQEGQPAYKILAAITLARLGHITAIKPLYAALRDRDATVRSAAYRALTDLQVRLGQSLPGLT
ncbi:MAG: HEAT repeat domain-containing protein [Chloroflexi bacterium]|nr:HEAT repeat domain-containing protein [Chloroflexota bacterium]